MNFKEKDILLLDDDKEYAVSSIINIENVNYAVIVDVADLTNIKYVKCCDDGNLEEIEDAELVRKIAEAIAKTINYENLQKSLDEINK